MTGQGLATARTRPPAAAVDIPRPQDRHTRHTAALDALLTLWQVLEDMGEDEATAFLCGPAAAFIPCDVASVLDSLRRDRARRATRCGL